MKKRVVDIISIVLSICLAAGVMLVFHACEPMDDGMYMNCHNAQIAVFIIAIVITLLLAFKLLFGKRKALRLIPGLLVLVLSVAAALVPNVFVRLCAMNTMRCHSVMRPAVIILCVLLSLASALDIALTVRSKNEPS